MQFYDVVFGQYLMFVNQSKDPQEITLIVQWLKKRSVLVVDDIT